MRNPSRRRVAFAALAVCALLFALQASRWQIDTAPQDVSLAAPRRVRVNPVAPVREVDTQEDAPGDPFAPRGWDAAPAAVVPAAAIVAPAIVVPPPAPAAPVTPALPFAFMGRMNDGASDLVYLSRGEESWTVKGGETLDASYKIISITPQQIVFEHLPTGTQQTLALPEPDK